MEPFLLALGLINAVGLCLVALLLLAVVRRLSELDVTARSFELPPDIRRIADGERLPDLAGIIDGGDSLSGREIAGPAIVSILSSSCSSCVERAAELAAVATAKPRARLVVLLAESATETAQLDRSLGSGIEILRFADSEQFHDSYLVDATPFHYVLDDRGRVVNASIELEPALAAFESNLPFDDPVKR